MNRVLIDAHVFLWTSDDPAKVSPGALAAIEAAGATLLSVASCWEIAIKHNLGRLPDTPPLDELFHLQSATGISLLDVTLPHVLRVADLPHHYRDPFDRMLVAQALVEAVPLISRDPVLDAYGIERI